jgi:hypothetical protein
VNVNVNTTTIPSLTQKAPEPLRVAIVITTFRITTTTHGRCREIGPKNIG